MSRIARAIRNWVSGARAPAAMPSNGEGLQSAISEAAMAAAIAERRDWMDERGFMLVVSFGMLDGTFDRNKIYQFMHDAWSEPSVCRLSDFHPLMNISRLRYRELDTSPHP